MKIQIKITLLFTLLCTSIIVALSFAVYYFTYQNASQDFYTRLELRANIAARANLEENDNTIAFGEIRRLHLQRLPEEREFIIYTDTLQRLYNNRLSRQLPADFIQAILINGKASYRNDFDFFQGILYPRKDKKYMVIVAAENSFLKGFLYNLQKILTAACVVGFIFVFSTGLFFSKQILAPIRNIARHVQRITATSLHMRLNTKNSKDEIAMLTNTFNDMLNRLETAFETQNNFVSNASHELNTPLTAIIGEADYALARPRSQEQYKQSLAIIIQQGEKLQHITQSLVQLARSGFRENLTMERVDVNELLHNAKQNVHYVYNQCTIHTDTSLYPEDKQQLIIIGNQQLLELALSNVLLNACKYSSNQPVSVALAVSATHVIIVVKDNGIGIPENELKNIFDPFFRASNVQTIDGYGIGLPLTQNIIRLHKGLIEINSHENAGTEVSIKLPKPQFNGLKRNT